MSLIPLHAGGLSLAFDSSNGAVNHINVRGRCVLRGITAPVRDHAWGTVNPVVSDLDIDQRADRFTASFNVQCRAHDIDFVWRGTLSGAAERLEFDFDGEALSTFRRNRIGFCILHPADAAGAACVVEHVDGRIERGWLPREISPHQPFLNLRAITHDVAPGLQAEVRMEGDTFEMEDQRNWTDASFKTYCTPLAIPYPVEVQRGVRIRQTVILRTFGSAASDVASTLPWEPPASVMVSLDRHRLLELPRLGTSWNVPDISPGVLAGLRTLGLDHLRVDLPLGDATAWDLLRSVTEAAAACGASLEIGLHVTDHAESELQDFLPELDLARRKTAIARWLIFGVGRSCTPPDLVRLARHLLEEAKLQGPVGGGTLENFTELNREPAVGLAGDFTVHACNPQVHAFDEESILETLGVQATTVDSARKLSGGRPVVVSPITFTPRWRQNAVGAPAARFPGLMPFREDPRHNSHFVANWTLGSIATLARAGADSVTYFELMGANGIFDARGDLTAPGSALQRVCAIGDQSIISAEVDHPSWLSVLAIRKAGAVRVALTNLREAGFEVMLEDRRFRLSAFETVETVLA